MLLLAVPHLVQGTALGTAKILGMLASIATFWTLLGWRPGSTGSRGTSRASAAALWLALPATAVHAVSGMETALFTLWVTLLFRAADETISAPGSKLAAALPLFALLAGVTRPEGHALAAVLVAWTAAQISPARRRAFLLRAAVVWLLPLALHEAWRLAYYGLPVPLTFYVKFGVPGTFPGLDVVTSWLVYLGSRMGWLLLPALVPLSKGLRGPCLAAALMASALIFSQHLMGYDWRFLAPLTPLTCAITGCGLDRWRTWMAPHLGGMTTLLLGTLATLGIILWLAAAGPSVIAERNAYATGLSRAHIPLGEELSALKDKGLRLALSDAGAIPYLSDAWTLDLGGLNTAHVALTRDRSPAYVLGRGVNTMILVSGNPVRFESHDWNRYEELLYESAVQHGFRRVGVRCFDDRYWLWVMSKPGGLSAPIDGTALNRAASTDSSAAKTLGGLASGHSPTSQSSKQP
jgi:hypothetical protein